METKTPAYFKARIALIEELLNTTPDTGEKNNNHVLLRNGIIPAALLSGKSEYAAVLQKMNNGNFSDAPLSFFELCRWNTWFALHPDKVAGTEIITTSYEFPITIKGSKEDIINVLTPIKIISQIKEKKSSREINKEIWQMTKKESFHYLTNNYMEVDYGYTKESRKKAELHLKKILNNYPKLEWNDSENWDENKVNIAKKLYLFFRKVVQYCESTEIFEYYITTTGGFWSVLHRKGLSFTPDMILKAMNEKLNVVSGIKTKRRKYFDTEKFVEMYGRKTIIEDAFFMGKPIPEKVLKEYPDLHRDEEQKEQWALTYKKYPFLRTEIDKQRRLRLAEAEAEILMLKLLKIK